LLLHQQEEVDISSVYSFLDRFHKRHKRKVEDIAFAQTKKVLDGDIAVVFYDMTTLYFEAEDEDDLRKIGFSKDGEFQHQQIMLGLIVGENGYPIAYDIYEGNTFKGHTLIPVIERVCERFGFKKPIIVADSSLLSKSNLEQLAKQGYVFIFDARIKNEANAVKQQTLSQANGIKDGESFVVETPDKLRLVVSYSNRRAKKDASNRAEGLVRLESRIKTGKLTKKTIVNRGYNKFLKIESEVKGSIDASKITENERWDGLKRYVTNSSLEPQQVIINYNHLWKIERAYSISKSDLRIRPIYHRKKGRIEAHICIAFVAYSVFKELEGLLCLADVDLSPQKAIERTKTIFQVEINLPNSKKKISTFSQINEDHRLISERILPLVSPSGCTA
ncbi:MAG: IS1634 family transposase, partial [SAR324 cluster bacterium]|nr:IS1634 family transposase [SAR324 cluster bacterium]